MLLLLQHKEYLLVLVDSYDLLSLSMFQWMSKFLNNILVAICKSCLSVMILLHHKYCVFWFWGDFFH